MNTKQRNVVYQRWSGAIRRETRDLVSLERISTRALADNDVRDDSTLRSMIQADLQKRRCELEQELQTEQSRNASSGAPANEPSSLPEAIPAVSPKQVREAFNELARALYVSLERSDVKETRIAFKKMITLQEQSPEVIPATLVGKYEQQVEKLRNRIGKLADEIATLTERAVSASSEGNEQELVQSMCRLTAIHAAYPHLLDESGLEDVRRDAARAADDRREHKLTTKSLLKRERAITSEIETLATAVCDFHRVACTVPDTSQEFREAEATYSRAIQKVRTYDAEWFLGVVLDLADLLAEWSVPPPGAEGQIDCFLDRIKLSLDRIRAEMLEIENEKDSEESKGNDYGLT